MIPLLRQPARRDPSARNRRANEPLADDSAASADDAATDDNNDAAMTDEDSADSDGAAKLTTGCPATQARATISPNAQRRPMDDDSTNGTADRGTPDADTSSSLGQYDKQGNVQLDEHGECPWHDSNRENTM